jgi:glucose-1-phosphate cytidylyltransferase
MKAVILAGGYGTRISEESGVRPKPMVEVGDRPILWHIMKIYSHYNINEFIICLGYKGYIIKEYFANYFLHQSDVTFDLKYNTMSILNNQSENWKVTLVDTGTHSMTGGRLKRVKEYLGNETFCMTYGDGVSNVDINETIKFHKEQDVVATLMAVQEPGRFGTFSLSGDQSKSTVVFLYWNLIFLIILKEIQLFLKKHLLKSYQKKENWLHTSTMISGCPWIP